MQIKYIDGIRLQKAVHAGVNNVINRKDYLNKINVFPVPDGDTGTNMAYTLSTIANEIKSSPDLNDQHKTILVSYIDRTSKLIPILTSEELIEM